MSRNWLFSRFRTACKIIHLAMAFHFAVSLTKGPGNCAGPPFLRVLRRSHPRRPTPTASTALAGAWADRRETGRGFEQPMS